MQEDGKFIEWCRTGHSTINIPITFLAWLVKSSNSRQISNLVSPEEKGEKNPVKYIFSKMVEVSQTTLEDMPQPNEWCSFLSSMAQAGVLGFSMKDGYVLFPDEDQKLHPIALELLTNNVNVAGMLQS